MKKYLNNQEARQYYVNTYVLSVFNYGSSVWHFSGLVETHKIERVHERALRFVYDDQSTDYYKFLQNNNLKTLFGKRIRSLCCEIYKIQNEISPKYMKDIFEQ